MQALTAIAATFYALTLWMFAPESVWQKELEIAKRKRQNRLTAKPSESTPETVQPEKEAIAKPSEPTPITESIPESIPQLDKTPEATEETEPETVLTPEPESIPGTIEQAISTPPENDYTILNTTQLRELAKQRKLNWRPLVNGKRKPLNKPQLIELLTT